MRAAKAWTCLGFCLALTPGIAPEPRAADPTVRSVTFAGREWRVKAGEGLGPGPNRWSAAPESVRVDDQGRLRLAILPGKDKDGWSCSEIVIPRSLGYGEYRWVIEGDLATLDPRTVLGLFTYEDNDHEIDYELSRWGQPGNGNCQFVVQPYAPDSMHRFDAGGAKVLTCAFTWGEKAIQFECRAGDEATSPVIGAWTYDGPKVPRAGKESVNINFWLLDGKASPGMKAQEVTVRSFQFRPAPVEPK